MKLSSRMEKMLDAMDRHGDDFINRFSDISFDNMSVECVYNSQDWCDEDFLILLEAQYRQSEIHKDRIGK